MKLREGNPNGTGPSIVSWDTASTLAETSDYSVSTVWGIAGSDLDLLDVIRGRFKAPGLRRRVVETQIRTSAHATLIEDTDTGCAIGQELRSWADGGSLDWTSPYIRAVLVSRRRTAGASVRCSTLACLPGFRWCKAAHRVRSIMEHRLMARSTKTRSKSSRHSARTAATEAAPVQSAPRPGGKLGLIVERLSAKTGATADELVKATGWQRPSVLGALSRLRSRGVAMRLDAQPDRKAYRLDKSKG